MTVSDLMKLVRTEADKMSDQDALDFVSDLQSELEDLSTEVQERLDEAEEDDA